MSQRRNGFTLMELTIASTLTAFLAVMLSTTWLLFSRPTSDLVAWGQLFQEMHIAVTALARDLGGSLPDYTDPQDPDAPLGGKRQGLLIECRKFADSNGDHLQLCFDGGPAPNGLADWDAPDTDTVIDYYVDSSSHTLIRSKRGTPFPVAGNVAGMQVTDESVGGVDRLRIELTFQSSFPRNYRAPLTRTCTLITKKKP